MTFLCSCLSFPTASVPNVQSLLVLPATPLRGIWGLKGQVNWVVVRWVRGPGAGARMKLVVLWCVVEVEVVSPARFGNEGEAVGRLSDVVAEPTLVVMVRGRTRWRGCSMVGGCTDVYGICGREAASVVFRYGLG